MKTAEVAIEHVLAGVLALCAFVLPLFGGLNINPVLLQSGALIGVLGIAYLLGVVFDKVADTLLSPLEDGLRLDQANKKKPRFNGDAFPQDALEFALRGEKGGRLEWIDSLRSRIRTARGLAVLGLPAALGIAIYLNPPGVDDAIARTSLKWPHLAIALNLLLIVSSVGLSHVKGWKMPKTFELPEDDRERKKKMVEARKHMWIRSSLYLLMLFASALSMAIIAASQVNRYEIIAIGICGIVASLLALWAWRRITKTYMSFIYQKLPSFLHEGARQSP